MELEKADAIVKAIDLWRDTSVTTAGDAALEGLPYEGQDALERNPGRDFVAVEELLLIPGIDVDLFDGSLRDNVTLYGDGMININTASRDTLEAVFGPGYPNLADKIIDYRKGVDGNPGTDDDRWFVAGRSVIDRGDRGMVEVKDLSAPFSYDMMLGMKLYEHERIKKLIGSLISTTSEIYRATCVATVGRLRKDVVAVVKFNKPGLIREEGFAEEIPPPDIEYLYWHERR